MAKYIIKIECAEKDENYKPEYEQGIECDGFCIVADNGDKMVENIENLFIDTLSHMMAQTEHVIYAAVLAVANRAVVALRKANNEQSALANLFKAIANKE